MFSDTHFHLDYIDGKLPGKETARILSEMAKNDCFFGMDIGTKCDDLSKRLNIVLNLFSYLTEQEQNAVKKFLYFSAGIWPDVPSIKNRESCVKTLREQIAAFTKDGGPFSHHLAAIGEGGIDHHWNPSGADGRCEADFDKEVYDGERELFIMQLLLAKELDLPFVVHSRDGFKDTLECIKESSYNRGIIHCYSYGIDEARSFLDAGWYLAFGGAVTYTKKSKMQDMEELLRFVPGDRLLLETDAPYLSPVPLRGQMNTPLNIRHTYDFIAQKRGCSVQELCALVDKNCKLLFRLGEA